jgi:hypothetical protein
MSMHTRTGCDPAVASAAFSIMSRCSGQSTITVTALASAGAAASSASACRSAVGYATRMSSLTPHPASHSASGRVNAMTPENPSIRSACVSSARQRSDLLATRIGLPAARRARAAAFSRNAVRSTTANGGSRPAVAVL